MVVQENVSLKLYNTFGVDVRARYFARVESVEELTSLLRNSKKYRNMYILGGGSNVLFIRNFDGLVVQVSVMGKRVVEETPENVLVYVAAGENWHYLVTWSVENNYEGIENMALIPGTIGGAIVGNIAAYGQNLSDVLVSVEVLDQQQQKVITIPKASCELQYRSSRFKRERNLVVLGATIELRKQYDTLETSYHERKGRFGSIEEELKKFAETPYKMKDVYEAVIRIRKNKLPDPAEQGTVGSYFINPMVTKEKYEELAKKIPELQSYPVEDLRYTQKDWQDIKDSHVKIPAGRLLDELGWRGKWEGHVGISDKHALCVITDKQATGQEIFEFAEKVKKSTFDAYGIELESEIDIVR